MVRQGSPAASGHLLDIEPEECRRLLRDTSIGRLSWQSSDGLVTLPVAFGVHPDGRLAVRVATDSLLSELAGATPVAFEADDLDTSTLTGWSVLVQGVAQSWSGNLPVGLVRPWAPGERHVALEVIPHRYTGRIVSAPEEGH